MKVKKMKTTFIILIIVSLLFTACTATQNTVPVSDKPQTVVEENVDTTIPQIVITREDRIKKAALLAQYLGTPLAGETTFYLQFNDADYEMALAEDKLIFLNFYSTGCDSCQKDNDAAISAFDAMKYEDVVGFRVLFNDPALTLEEKDIALKYGVENLNTKVIVKGGKRVFKATDTWNKQTFIDEISRNRG